MGKSFRKILTSVLALLMAVTVMQPIKVSADSNPNDVILTAATEDGLKVTVVRDERAYPARAPRPFVSRGTLERHAAPSHAADV